MVKREYKVNTITMKDFKKVENGTIDILNGEKYRFCNGAYFIDEPIKGNFKELLQKDISTIYEIVNILSGNMDSNNVNF